MPRMPRFDVPGIAQHVVQRGNDRQRCFFCDEDYGRYLQDLRATSLLRECRVHAYVLMTNHVHLLVTPGSAGAVGRMMQDLGRRYVRHVNASQQRTGTLWEGRYKACLVDSERYALACYRYIELNPVRAGIVADPLDYPWSSYACNAFGSDDPRVTMHESYLDLATDADERRTHYRALIADGLDADDLAAIRSHTQRQRALGSAHFQANIDTQVGRLARPGANRGPNRGQSAL